MLRLFLGLGLLVGSACALVVGMYYGSLLGTPDLPASITSRYTALSNVFGILTYGLLALGVVTVVMAVRAMNAEYKKERARAPSSPDAKLG